MDKPLIKDVRDVKPILNNINWSFYPKPPILKDVVQPFNSRKYHWYPATYIPEIPYSLIEILTLPGAKVFDPFMGIGTTFFQTLIQGRIPYANDVSKISYEFVKTLYNLFDPTINHSNIQKKIKNDIASYNNQENYLIKESNPYIDEFKKWYSDDNFNAISFLIQLKNTQEDNLISSIYSIVISSLLNSSSNQDRGMSCIADNMLPKLYQIREVDVCKVFLSSVNRLISDIKETISLLPNEYSSFYENIKNKELISNNDISEIVSIEDSSIDIVISSPPYPNMIDYTTSQRLAYYYYGEDLNEHRKREIGARYRRNVKNTLQDYYNRMSDANKNIIKTLKTGGLLCYVMPSFNSDNEKNIDRKQIIQKVMAKLEDEQGMTKEMEIERVVPSLRRTHNSKWTTLEKEMIYIYRKI
ncbi:hypothetical protein [Dysgonomonas sp. 37-18]|uniref:hypothetical protein n=1 Tax=Dysgonomonas sp. 37-18 TaxID=1895907 RepID=UPI00092BB81D|nr:hypothetical protein [Dysgonomonas sp. 37-18]OJX63748.1 MAG: hypothetical protein BGO84_13550 [Dysgonomonas sp. 37-18]